MRFSANNPVKTAWFLALAGFVPFAAMAMLMLASGKYHPFFPVIEDAFRTYSAIILSFLGGTRWGMALLGKTVSARVISFSVLPALCGWLALFLPAPVSITILLLGYCAQGAWDSMSIHAGGAPDWFAQLRIILTLLVAFAHLLAFIAAY